MLRLARAFAVALLLLTCGQTGAHSAPPPAESPLPDHEAVRPPVRPVDASAAHAEIGALIPIEDELGDVTVETVKRRIAAARERGATTIIFSMDTPGGLVTSSIAIADLIKELTDVRTVAWVNPNAHSGGALVAVAAEEIVMTRSSRLGNAQVIFGGPTGASGVPDDLAPKAQTPVLAEFRASAKLRGYDQVLCEAFVVPDREVWWLENIKTGKREFVLKDEKERRLREAENSTADGSTAGEALAPEWRAVERYYDPVLERETEVIQPIDRDDQNLEMSAGEAYAYGFSRAVVSSEAELKQRYGLTQLIRIDVNWSESLAGYLTSPAIRGILLAIVMLAIYMELHTPGLGLAGVVALVGLAIFVIAPYLTGLANIWEILFIIVGLVLIAVEVFVLPGFGIPGIAGIMLVFIGMLATFVPDEPGRTIPLYLPSFEGARDALKVGVVTISSSLLASVIGMVMLSRMMPRVPLLSSFLPDNPRPVEVQVEDAYHGLARIGDIGRAVGPLRPAGKARFGGVLVDVVSQGDFIEPDLDVEVVERRGNKVVVRPRPGGAA